MIESTAAVLAALTGIAVFYFWFERFSGWKIFKYLIPLIWIYATPMVLRNVGVLPDSSPAYDAIRQFGLPAVITLLLLAVNVGATFRIMGRGVLVMLLGTLGIVVGAPIAYFIVHGWLEPDAWKGFAALSGSWIGGTGNLAAAAAAFDTPEEQFGLAVLADNVVYVVWLPLLLGSKAFADKFNAWAKVAPDRLKRMEEAAAEEEIDHGAPEMRHYLYLAFLALGATWLSGLVAPGIHAAMMNVAPWTSDVFTVSTWQVLMVTVIGLALSFTPARTIPGSHNLAMAILYVFVARMGATASLAGLSQAPAFILGAFIWIFIHGFFCLAGAKLLKVDVHSVAIASAANVGAAASAPVVAAHHRESLVPAAILMALIGYAIGNPLSILVIGPLCYWVGGGG